ncbi:MAG: YHS domain-containing protein [Verrucomicrobia bacterium]|nr:YHS domain-containing protein [Verrucomicrobiota bacterium]
MKFAVFVTALGMLTSYKVHASGLEPELSVLKAAGLEPDLPVGDTPQLQVWFEKGTHKLNVDSKGVILKGYDPVAYFTLHRAVKGNPKYQSAYQGATYYFASAADLATFKKDPSKYIPQYGGFCANSMKDRKATDIDPTVFFITKGKLYVCSSPAAEKEFRTHEEENIKKADQNWGEEYEWFY